MGCDALTAPCACVQASQTYQGYKLPSSPSPTGLRIEFAKNSMGQWACGMSHVGHGQAWTVHMAGHVWSMPLLGIGRSMASHVMECPACTGGPSDPPMSKMPMAFPYGTVTHVMHAHAHTSCLHVSTDTPNTWTSSHTCSCDAIMCDARSPCWCSSLQCE